MNFMNLCDALSQSGYVFFQPYSHTWIETYVMCQPITDKCRTMDCESCSMGLQFPIRVPVPEDSETALVTYPRWQKDAALVGQARKKAGVERVVIQLSVSKAFEQFSSLVPSFLKHNITKQHVRACATSGKSRILQVEWRKTPSVPL